jgi:hypothetical protein
MRRTRIRVLFAASIFAAAGLAAAHATANHPYDGSWSVTVMTKNVHPFNVDG